MTKKTCAAACTECRRIAGAFYRSVRSLVSGTSATYHGRLGGLVEVLVQLPERHPANQPAASGVLLAGVDGQQDPVLHRVIEGRDRAQGKHRDRRDTQSGYGIFRVPLACARTSHKLKF